MSFRTLTVAVHLCSLICSLQILLASSSIPTDVIVLTDSTFEHATQASTGQTTGIWCILITASSTTDAHHESMQLWTELAAVDDKEALFAMVDLDANEQLAQRFNNIKVPSAVLLRDRAMYVYSIPNEDDSAEIINAFLAGGYTQLPRQVVPPPSSGLLGSKIKGRDSDGADNDIFKLKIALMVMVLAILWKIAVFVTRTRTKSTSGPAESACNQGLTKSKTESTTGPELRLKTTKIESKKEADITNARPQKNKASAGSKKVPKPSEKAS